MNGPFNEDGYENQSEDIEHDTDPCTLCFESDIRSSRDKKKRQEVISHVLEKWTGDKKKWNKCKYYVHFNDEVKGQERMSDR